MKKSFFHSAIPNLVVALASIGGLSLMIEASLTAFSERVWVFLLELLLAFIFGVVAIRIHQLHRIPEPPSLTQQAYRSFHNLLMDCESEFPTWAEQERNERLRELEASYFAIAHSESSSSRAESNRPTSVTLAMTTNFHNRMLLLYLSP